MARRHRKKQREVTTTSHGGRRTRRLARRRRRFVRRCCRPITFGMRCFGGVAALLVARPLVPSDGGAAVGNGQVAVALWIALAALWIVQSLGRPQLRVRFGWIDAAMVAFIGWWTVAALIWNGSRLAAAVDQCTMGRDRHFAGLPVAPAIDRAGSKWKMGCGTRIPGEVPVPIISPRAGVGRGDDRRRRDAGDSGALSVFRHAAGRPSAVHRKSGGGVSRGGDRHAGADSPEFRLAADRFNSPEPFATFSLTNSLAAYLAPWLVVTLGIALVGWRASQAGPLGSRRRWAIVGCAVDCAGLSANRSRSAWIGTGIGVVCVVIWRIAVKRRESVSAPSPGKAASAFSISEVVCPPSLGFKPLAIAP